MRLGRLALIHDVEWVLSVGIGKCYRSTTGGMLERAQAMRYDSSGKRILLPKDTWSCMMPKAPASQASYELEFRDLFRIGRVSRWLVELGRTDPTSADVIVRLHGDVGARWGRDKLGRDVALYPVTKTGRAILESIRRRFPLSVELRDEEVIAQDLIDQSRQPNDIRARRHARMRNEADVLKELAHRALQRAAS